MSAPTLIIGLGGTGCKIVERVSQMVTPEQRRNIAFTVFDTDINDLRGIKERNPFIQIIQTSTKQTVGEYLNTDTHARDTWFPVNSILNGKPLTEGAGQVRSISRLALDTVIRAGKMEPLHAAIDKLFKVEENKLDQAIRIIVVSSLAGGTGSGLILPVALYTRNYLKNHFKLSTNITRGFFVLPEVFNEVIKRQGERNNLKANAYATLRELDAFLMKGDHILDNRYKNTVFMEFPIGNSEKYEQYDVCPYDFCFLFDAQNAEGAKLNSFDQYLDHAANCIYAQSIGPMNKRSNSSEDNTIRGLANEQGRNRYAGAGASMLIYPFEDIRKLLALNWAKNAISKKWLNFDKLYNDRKKEIAENQEQMGVIKDIAFDTFYVNQIEADAKQDEPFAEAIYRSTAHYKKGVVRDQDKYITFVTSLLKKVEDVLNPQSTELQATYGIISSTIQEYQSKGPYQWDKYRQLYSQIKDYDLLFEKHVDEVKQSIAYTMFKSKRKESDSTTDYKFIHYLSNGKDDFMHPNAVRYLLIKTVDYMNKIRDSIKRSRVDDKLFIDDFIKVNCPEATKNDSNHVFTESDLNNKREKFLQKIFHKQSAEQNMFLKNTSTLFDKCTSYNENCAKEYILTIGIKYFKGLIAAFDDFYKSLERKIDTLDKEIDDIYKKYRATSGRTVRYVCASEECFDQLCEKKMYLGSAINIDSKLAETIYLKINDFALMNEKPNSNRYFNNLFDKDIIGYFKSLVMDKYSSELDVDIITAIENEAFYLGKAGEDGEDKELVDAYVCKVIDDTRQLSCPFIESPLGFQTDPINSCTFNSGIVPEKGDESPKAHLIKKMLMDFGGEPDEDISKNMIMFYQSFYGLRANQLSKFAPAEHSKTYTRAPGEYFKAYYDQVSAIHPMSSRSKEISPQIGNLWHIVTKMPDLDEKYQRYQEYRIYAAFMWSIVNKYIYLSDESRSSKVYKLNNISIGMDDQKLLCSNGTECGKLCDVLDAVAIYPELIDKILTRVNTIISNDVNENVSLEKTILYKQISSFILDKEIEGIESSSLFDLPLLIKNSLPANEYYEANVVDLVTVAIEEIKRFLKSFYNEKELPYELYKIVSVQLDNHLRFIDEVIAKSYVYPESLYTKVCDAIIREIDDTSLRNEINMIQDKIKQYRKKLTDK